MLLENLSLVKVLVIGYCQIDQVDDVVQKKSQKKMKLEILEMSLMVTLER